MKIIISFLLIALLVSSNGCMTGQTVQRAKGYTKETIQPLKGDTVFQHGGLTYIIQHKHAEGETNSVLVLPYNVPTPYLAYRPSPAYYVLIPFAFVGDIVTFPFQLFVYGEYHSGKT